MRFAGILCWASGLMFAAGDTRLADAIRLGRYPDAHKLAEKGADPNGVDSRQNTPLHWAAAAGEIKLADMLLKKQALLNAVRRSPSFEPEYDALRLAALNQHTPMVDFLLSHGADPRPAAVWINDFPPSYRNKLRSMIRYVNDVIGVTRAGNVQQLERLLFAGPTEWRQAGLNAALCATAATGQERLVAALVERGANPVADFGGQTALEMAASENKPEIVKFLISRGIRKEVVREAWRRTRSRDSAGVVKAFGRIAQEEEESTRTEDVRSILDGLNRTAVSLRSPDAERITKSIDWFKGKVASGRPSRPSAEYVRALQIMSETLTRRPDAQTVQDIADELEAKVAYCRTNSVGMGGSVTLQVRTRNQQKEIPNWQIYYLLKIYEHYPSATPGAFLKWSSPSSEAVEPGRYWIWAKDPASNRMSERKLVSLSGANEVTVDLFVP